MNKQSGIRFHLEGLLSALRGYLKLVLVILLAGSAVACGAPELMRYVGLNMTAHGGISGRI